MNKTLKLITKQTLQLTALLPIITVALVQCDIIWLPPKLYQPKERLSLQPPIMTLDAYISSGLIDTQAMAEGSLDLIPWFINSVKASGEGGYTQKLAKSNTLHFGLKLAKSATKFYL